MELTIKINTKDEMIAIYKGTKCILYGNYWDFDVPGGIIQLIEDLDIKYDLIVDKEII